MREVVALEKHPIGLDAILCAASLESGLFFELIDELLKKGEIKRTDFNINTRTLAEAVLAWEKLPWLGDEKILKLSFIAGYYENKDLKIYHFLQVVCNATRVLFIRNSTCYAHLKFFAEALFGQLHELCLENITPAEKAELAFAYVTTPALYEKVPERIRV